MTLLSIARRRLPALRKAVACTLSLFALALPQTATAAEPSTVPQLRIEAGMHTANIRRVATDADARYVVTASDDKTARVWSRATGELLVTLRPPAGLGKEGMLNAVAMSPDGATVAVGGWTKGDDGRPSPPGGHNIYFFDRASGQLKRRIAGLQNVIISLAYTPDGRALSAGLGNQAGVRVFDPTDGRLLGEDRGIGGDVYGLSWFGSRFAATSFDGKIRLYELGASGLRKLAEMPTPGGSQPYGIAFSPDGTQLAVGYEDTPAVSVLDGRTLELRFAADTAGLGNVNLTAVAWDADQTLWAAGRYQRQVDGRWRIILRRWPHGGRGAVQETPVSGGTVMSLIALPGGGMLFGAADPAWGEVDAGGQRVRFVGPPLRDYRTHLGRLEVSASGQTVAAGIRFTLRERQFNGPARESLFPAGVTASGLTVEQWENRTGPRLNGQPLKLQTSYEVSRSLAIAADAQSFASGSDWFLRRFDRNGSNVWQRAAPGAVWSVNLANQDRTLVAAYADGTIRWHRYADGQELLALYAHPDEKRWVLWTPSGYYDASPGAEDLIGFHVNRGKDSAGDFFPAARFRSTLYRPDVIDQVLDTLDEAEALKLADAQAGKKAVAVVKLDDLGQKLPPVVTLLSPESGSRVSSNLVAVRIQTRSAGDAPVTALRVRVNGQPVEIDGQRALKPKTERQDATTTLNVPVPTADSEVTIFAENRHGTSTPASLKLVWGGATPSGPVEAEFVAKPKLYVLAVGVSNYRLADLKLAFAAKDARDFVAAVQKQKGTLYRDVVVKLLTDEKASRDEVLDGLEWIRREVTQRDVGMVFLAGHGFNDADGVFYYLPVEGDPDRIKRTGVVYNEIKSTLTNLAGKSIFFVDACHSGNVLGDGVKRRGQADMNFIVNELSSAENGVLVFASSTGRQFSLENTAWGNGAFTKALVEGLTGQADYNKTGRITHKMLDLYVSERVKELTKGQQTPKTLTPQGVTDYPVAVVK